MMKSYVLMVVLLVVSVSARHTVLERMWGIDTVEPEYVDSVASEFRFVEVEGGNFQTEKCSGVDNKIMPSVDATVIQMEKALPKNKKGEYQIKFGETLSISIKGKLLSEVGKGWHVGTDMPDGGTLVRFAAGFPRTDPLSEVIAAWKQLKPNDPTIPKGLPFKGDIQIETMVPVPAYKWGLAGSYGKVHAWLQDEKKVKKWCVTLGPFALVKQLK